MKRLLQFSLESLLAIPLIVALGLYIYKAHAAQVELQDRLDFINSDSQSLASETEIRLYKEIVSHEENRPYFADLELVRKSEAHFLNFLPTINELIEFHDNQIVVIKGADGRPYYMIFQIDRSHKIRKFIGRNTGEYISYKIAGNTAIITCRKVGFGTSDDPFEIVFDYVE